MKFRSSTPNHSEWCLVYCPAYCQSRFQVARFIKGKWETEIHSDITKYVISYVEIIDEGVGNGTEQT